MRPSEREDAIIEKIKEIRVKTKKMNEMTDSRLEDIDLSHEEEIKKYKEKAEEQKERRQQESESRIAEFTKDERKKQKYTSYLVRNLLAICEKEETPSYVRAMAKVLDNFQGICIVTLIYMFY